MAGEYADARLSNAIEPPPGADAKKRPSAPARAKNADPFAELRASSEGRRYKGEGRPPRGRTVAAATPTLPPAPVESEPRTPNPYPLAPNPEPPVSFSFSSQGASNGTWSTLNRKVVNFEQTGTLWRFIVIMAVPEEGEFVVSLMVSLLPRKIEKRGYCSVALALLCQSTSEVA